MSQTHFFGGNSDVGGVKRRFQFALKFALSGVLGVGVGIMCFVLAQKFSSSGEGAVSRMFYKSQFNTSMTIMIVLGLAMIIESVFMLLKTGHYLEVCEYGIRGKGGVGSGYMSLYKLQTFSVRYADIVSLQKTNKGLAVTTSGGTYMLGIRDIDEAIRAMEEQRKMVG